MKKSLLIFCAVIITLSVTALGVKSWNQPSPIQKKKSTESSSSLKTSASISFDLVNNVLNPGLIELTYKVESRFANTISKEKLHNATSIFDIVEEKEHPSIVSYQIVSVAILQGETEIRETSESPELNDVQRKLLQAADYSTDIVVKAYYQYKAADTDQLVSDYLSYYLTITPEKEAVYSEGQDALIEYLKVNSLKAFTTTTPDQLKSGRLNFQISKTGEIKKPSLDSSSGYPAIDEKMLELIENMPGEWQPALNANGEKVEQEFVFFYGLQGC